MEATAGVGERSSVHEWFSAWFDTRHYQQLYAHRGDHEAGALIDKLIARLEPAEGAAMLDLACGTGRHARHLAARGFHVTGLDLSAVSITQAREHEGPRLRFCRHDMRRPFGVDAFDYVFNLFTSFGYFEHPAENLTVVANIARALRPGGTLVLDYLNVEGAEVRLVPEEVIAQGRVAYRVFRWTDRRHLFKQIVIDEGAGGRPVEHTERIARLTVEDFRYMFALYDLRIEASYGDYSLDPFVPSTSPRLILVASRGSGPQSGGAARKPLTDPTDGFRCHAEI
jgi:SAM-dependent methyltransferase